MPSFAPLSVSARKGPTMRLSSSFRKLRFTREGKYYVLLTFGVGLAAINSGNNLLYLILGMLLAFIIASGVLSDVVMANLSIERAFPLRIFASTPCLIHLTVKRKMRHVSSYAVEVTDLVHPPMADHPCFFLKVAPGTEESRPYQAEFSQAEPEFEVVYIRRPRGK